MPSFEIDALLPALRDQGVSVVAATAMTGDVSQRRYLRLTLEGGAGSAVLALYPPALLTAARRYRLATALFEGVGLRVPAILATDPNGRWIVTEDFGPATVFDLRDQPFDALEPFFFAAIATLPRIASLDRGRVVGLNPPLDAALLGRELALTRRAFFEPRGLALGAEVEAALARLCARLGDESRVPCHRDFGVRNLLPLGSTVGIVDHQDLRLGPPAYDLASLLNDSLFPTAEAEERLLQAAGNVDRETYHRTAAQRSLKAVGTYAMFSDRSPRYLPLIAPTLQRALVHLAQTPETAALAPELAERWSGLLNPVC